MTKAELVASVYNAFKDVHLEDGIGFYEADCIDDYLSPDDEEYISWKQKDERDNWEKLLPVFLSEGTAERVHSGNWHFMDAKGKRFHLPCYLLLDIDNNLKGENPLIILLINEPADLSELNILDAIQKQAIIDFFEYKEKEFLKDKNDFDFANYYKAKEVFLNNMKK